MWEPASAGSIRQKGGSDTCVTSGVALSQAMSDIRPAAVAGSWYSANAEHLAREVDRYLEAAAATPPISNVLGLIAPHAGLMYSGPVAAHAYRQLRDRSV